MTILVQSGRLEFVSVNAFTAIKPEIYCMNEKHARKPATEKNLIYHLSEILLFEQEPDFKEIMKAVLHEPLVYKPKKNMVVSNTKTNYIKGHAKCTTISVTEC